LLANIFNAEKRDCACKNRLDARDGFLARLEIVDGDLLVRRRILPHADAGAVLADDFRPAIAVEYVD